VWGVWGGGWGGGVGARAAQQPSTAPAVQRAPARSARGGVGGRGSPLVALCLPCGCGPSLCLMFNGQPDQLPFRVGLAFRYCVKHRLHSGAACPCACGVPRSEASVKVRASSHRIHHPVKVTAPKATAVSPRPALLRRHCVEDNCTGCGSLVYACGARLPPGRRH